LTQFDTGKQFDAYILKFPTKASGRVIEEEYNAPEGETLREHSLSGKVV